MDNRCKDITSVGRWFARSINGHSLMNIEAPTFLSYIRNKSFEEKASFDLCYPQKREERTTVYFEDLRFKV